MVISTVWFSREQSSWVYIYVYICARGISLSSRLFSIREFQYSLIYSYILILRTRYGPCLMPVQHIQKSGWTVPPGLLTQLPATKSWQCTERSTVGGPRPIYSLHGLPAHSLSVYFHSQSGLDCWTWWQCSTWSSQYSSVRAHNTLSSQTSLFSSRVTCVLSKGLQEQKQETSRNGRATSLAIFENFPNIFPYNLIRIPTVAVENRGPVTLEPPCPKR